MSTPDQFKARAREIARNDVMESLSLTGAKYYQLAGTLKEAVDGLTDRYLRATAAILADSGAAGALRKSSERMSYLARVDGINASPVRARETRDLIIEVEAALANLCALEAATKGETT